MFNMKALEEQRDENIKIMNNLLENAKKEERALSDEDQKAFEEAKATIERIDKTLQAEKDLKEKEEKPVKADEEDVKDKENSEQYKDKQERAIEEKDIRDFAEYVRAKVEQRADDANMTQADNGAVIPKTIADKIISRVQEMCPIFERSEQYNVKGTLSIPYVDDENSNLTASFKDEMEEVESTALKLKTIDLSGFLVGCLSIISVKFINNTDINITNLVVEKMAEQVSLFLEKEILTGEGNKITGCKDVTNTIETAAVGTITADDVIKLKDKIKTAYQKDAFFIMNPDTLTSLRLLKDGNGRYLLNDDITSAYGNTLLGKDVFLSDNMPKIADGGNAILYVDAKNALAVKVTENMEIQLLREKYATKHAVGVIGWLECDAKIQNQQAIAALTIKA